GGARAGVLPETWGDRRLARCRAGAWLGLADGEAAGDALALLCGAGACRAAVVWPAAAGWCAVDPVASRPFTAQLRLVRMPAPTPAPAPPRPQDAALGS